MDEPRDREEDAAERPREPGAGNFDAGQKEDRPENDRWWENEGGSGEVH